jgi:Fur family zinc uptake transcriptional regulator
MPSPSRIPDTLKHDTLKQPILKQDALKRAAALAQERGLSLTPLRRQVFEMVLGASQPIGAYDLLAALGPSRGRVPPTTVYRALDFLVQHGFIHRIESKNAFFACCSPDAPHQGQFLLCEECGRAQEIPGTELADALSSSDTAHGFEVHHQVVELSGICGECRLAREEGSPRMPCSSSQKSLGST